MRKSVFEMKGGRASNSQTPTTSSFTPPSLPRSVRLSCTDLTLNRKSFELGEVEERGGRGALLPCEESGIREGASGGAGPGLGITYQGPRTPNQPRLDSLAPASAYLPQTATGGPVRAAAPRCSPTNTATATSASAHPPLLLCSLCS